MVPLNYPDSSTDRVAPFGATGAATYDNDALQMPKRYKQAHSIQNKIVLKALRRRSTTAHPVVVDLGSGTANDGLKVLTHSARAFYVGIDQSGHMIARAKEKMRLHGLARRSLFLQSSFLAASVRDVLRVLHDAHVNCHVAVVMSALALHHYELESKRGVYALARDLLQPGSLFVLTDLFSNGIVDCARHALLKELGDLRAVIKRFGEEDVALRSTTLSVDHYTRSNKPQNLTCEMALLRESGFGSVDIVYRHGQLAVIVAERIE